MPSQETSSITPSLNGEVWWKSIRHPFLNTALPRVLRREPTIGRRSRSQEFAVSGRSVGTAVSDLRLGQQFTLSVMADSAQNPLTFARNFDLVLASGDVFFIHVPGGTSPSRLVPGGYVIVADTGQTPLTGGPDSPQEFTLPCTVVSPPPPEVVGTNLTWGTVFSLYGSWTALIAANPTWNDLLATVGSEEDLVVL